MILRKCYARLAFPHYRNATDYHSLDRVEHIMLVYNGIGFDEELPVKIFEKFRLINSAMG